MRKKHWVRKLGIGLLLVFSLSAILYINVMESSENGLNDSYLLDRGGEYLEILRTVIRVVRELLQKLINPV